MALQERRAITDPRLLVRCLAVLALVVTGFALHAVFHVEPVHRRPARRRGDGAGRQRRRRRGTSRRSSGRRWCSSWACSSWSAGWSTPASSARSAPWPTRRSATTDFARRDRRCCSARRSSARSSTTSPTPRRWRPIVEDMVAHGPRRRAPAKRCGGRSRSAPTSAATAPRSRPAPTSSPSASPPARAADQLLAVHPVRHRRHAAEHRRWPGSTSGCATSEPSDRRPPPFQQHQVAARLPTRHSCRDGRARRRVAPDGRRRHTRCPADPAATGAAVTERTCLRGAVRTPACRRIRCRACGGRPSSRRHARADRRSRCR